MKFLAGAVCGSDIPKYLGQRDPDNPYTGCPGTPLHEVVGRIEKSCSGHFGTGERVVGIVAQARGLAEYVVNPAEYLHNVDDRLSDVQATVVQPVATVLSALSSVSEITGRSVAVLGLGPLGILFAQAAKARGAAHVIGVDRIERADVADIFGIDEVVTTDVRNWATNVDEQHRPELVIDAIGHDQRIVNAAVEAVSSGGEVLVFGLPEDHYVFPMRAFFRKNLTLRAGATRDWRSFLKAAQYHVLKHDVLTTKYITHIFSIGAAQEAYQLYANPAAGQLKVALTPPEPE